MIKGSIQEEDITIINIYAPNIGAPQYVRQTLTSMKEEISSNTIIVGDFNTPLTTMDRSTKHKINKETQTLNDTMDQLDLIDIFKTFHPKTINFTFFSGAVLSCDFEWVPSSLCALDTIKEFERSLLLLNSNFTSIVLKHFLFVSIICLHYFYLMSALLNPVL